MKKIKYMIVLFFVSISVISCNTMGPKKIIEYIHSEFDMRLSELDKINTWILKQDYPIPYGLRRIRDKQTIMLDTAIGKPWISIEDINFSSFYYNFLISTKFMEAYVYDDVIVHSINIRNTKLEYYKILFIKEKSTTRFKSYKYYETGSIPVETSGWIYNLEGDWYLLSPIPSNM